MSDIFRPLTVYSIQLSRLRQGIARWLAPPVFPGDEKKTRRAAVLNFVLLTSIGAMALFILQDLSIAYPSRILIGLEVFLLGGAVAARQVARRGHVQAVSVAILAFGIVSLTLANIIFGTVRGPSAVGYLLLIVMASLLFAERGLTVTVVLCALCVVGLLSAEAMGLIRPEVRFSEEVEWLNLLIWLAAAAGLSYWGLRTTRTALARSERELAARRAAEAALLVAKEQAEAANRAKSEFLANMSHELRTPLNAILGFSELMSRDPNLSPVQAENLAIINRSGEHLLSLINDVLDMAKIEAGRTTLQERDFDLHAMLDNLLELFHLRAAARGLILVLSLWPDVPRHVHADENKLRQVLINLLGNAVKFTTAGSIELAVRRSDADAGAVGGAACRVHFAVLDTGSGIPSGDLEMVFEPFSQSASGKTMSDGTGLGLPISREFVRLMGGELTVTSVVGKGSHFQFEIPVIPVVGLADEGRSGRALAIGLAPGQPVYRLLVVDDSAENRKLLVDILTQLGFAVRTAGNGQEAVEVWQAWRPHLIWMDMRMPMVDGHEATRRIRAAPGGADTRIIAVSAGALADDRSTVLADGCDDFVAKPIRAETIVAQLVKHLGVPFTYAADKPTNAAAPAGAPATIDLAALPTGWISQVREAAVSAEARRLNELAAEIEGVQPALAAALREWVDQYDYDAILATATAAGFTPDDLKAGERR